METDAITIRVVLEVDAWIPARVIKPGNKRASKLSEAERVAWAEDNVRFRLERGHATPRRRVIECKAVSEEASNAS